MELIKYDAAARTSTISLANDELADIHSCLFGVLNTFSKQDPNIIGMPRERLDDIANRLSHILDQVNAVIVRKK